ncbi:hypothetical protein [Thiococcus pfennigii]|jgi:hypothetical protein|uniref:hypothetical protein n=1 Tax=Thiococcus pfennigii TaxID=1057 RepID=UPI001905DDFE|nr:hypothetical protein [Thiococcus pfennigii]MBK1701494.1 hypothetical protein [Thiococcus pfennigii]
MISPSTLVIDASVIIKWLFQDPERKTDTERATALIAAVARGDHAVLQPPQGQSPAGHSASAQLAWLTQMANHHIGE